MAYTPTDWQNGETSLSARNMNHIEQGIKDAHDALANMYTKEEIFDAIYPVDSIYMSINPVNPATLFGGTWIEWGKGKVPIGVDSSDTDFNSVEKSGGEKTHNHTNPRVNGTTLTAAQSGNQAQNVNTGGMSANSSITGQFTVRRAEWDGGDVDQVWGASGVFSESKTGTEAAPTYTMGVGRSKSHVVKLSKSIAHTHSVSIAAKNATQAHDHTQGNTGDTSTLQPYITCYMWKRTA